MKAEVSIPESLADIKLGDYQKLLDVVQQNEGAHEFINLKTVQYLCGIPFDLTNKIKKKNFDDILSQIEQVFKEEPKFIQRFTLNKKEFGFIPDLDNDLSAGEFADLSNYFDDWKQMHKAMAVLFRPINKTYQHQYLIEEYKGSAEYAEELKDMPLSVVMGSRLFFWNLGIALSKATLKSLRPGSQEGKALQQTLAGSGDGINPFTHSLEVVYSELQKRQN